MCLQQAKNAALTGERRSLGLWLPTVRRAPIALLLALFVLFGALPATAGAVDSAVAAARGGGLPTHGDLEWTANNSAANQAANLALGHTGLGHLTSICSRAAEIVGTGPSVDLIFVGFRNSATHYSKLVDPAWTAMGTGVATGSNGALYVSVVFCVESNPSGSTTPAPTPEPAPSPTPTAPSPGSTSGSNAPAHSASTAEPTVELDLMGLLSALLTTSLDSLTVPSDVSPIATLGGDFFVLRWSTYQIL